MNYFGVANTVKSPKSLSCFAFYKATQGARLESLPGWFCPPGLKFDIPDLEDKISVFIPWIINYFKQAKINKGFQKHKFNNLNMVIKFYIPL